MLWTLGGAPGFELSFGPGRRCLRRIHLGTARASRGPETVTSWRENGTVCEKHALRVSKPMNGGFFLAIAGNIGVGKTQLTNRLSQELGWAAHYEPVIQNPYLDPFYKDMQRWSFHLQIYFLGERFKAQVEIGKSQLPFIQDRTIYEDAEIFARTLWQQGSMTDVDYRNYVALFHCMVGFLRPPDLIVHLKASPEALMERIAKRGREGEKPVGSEPMQRLNAAYDDWMARAKTS